MLNWSPNARLHRATLQDALSQFYVCHKMDPVRCVSEQSFIMNLEVLRFFFHSGVMEIESSNTGVGWTNVWSCRADLSYWRHILGPGDRCTAWTWSILSNGGIFSMRKQHSVLLFRTPNNPTPQKPAPGSHNVSGYLDRFHNLGIAQHPLLCWTHRWIIRTVFHNRGCARTGAEVNFTFSSSNAVCMASEQTNLTFSDVFSSNGLAILANIGIASNMNFPYPQMNAAFSSQVSSILRCQYLWKRSIVGETELPLMSSRIWSTLGKSQRSAWLTQVNSR